MKIARHRSGIPDLRSLLILLLLLIATGGSVLAAGSNISFIPNTLFTAHEDLSSPRVKQLLETYPLEEVVAGETDEFRRTLLLRHWIYDRVDVDMSKPAASDTDVMVMLEACPDGGAYHCGHFMRMQQAVLNAMGHVARPMFAGAGAEEGPLSGAHGMNEIWINDLGKWVLFDAEYDAHYEIDGVPLSALEIRNAMWKDEGKDVVKVVGPDRTPVPRAQPDSYGKTPYTFKWISWYPEADIFTRDVKRSAKEIVVADDIWKNNTWYRGGRKHFAYDADLFVEIDNPEAVYWTPNVLKVDTAVDGDTASVFITSDTPNLKTYQIRRPDGEWRATPDEFMLDLEGGRRWQLRSVNTAGVSGPVYHLDIDR